MPTNKPSPENESTRLPTTVQMTAKIKSSSPALTINSTKSDGDADSSGGGDVGGGKGVIDETSPTNITTHNVTAITNNINLTSSDIGLNKAGLGAVGSENNHSSSRGVGGGTGEGTGAAYDVIEDEAGEETDVIGELVGHFGKWQFLMTILLSLFQVPNTFHISSPVYQAANKNFWCSRPDNLRSIPVDVWRNFSDSKDNCYQVSYDYYRISLSANSNMEDNLPDIPHNYTRIACSSWEYDMNDNLGNTWTSEWNLVCDKEYLKNVAEMFFLLGVATGGIISGYLSDKFGRKTMLFISAVLQTIFGLALYFANSFELYLILRTLLGLVSVSVTYAGLILAIEYVDGKWRTIAGMYNLFPLPISYMLISGIAYLTQDYQKLQLCIGFPGIFLCFLWFVVPESPRWLLCKGRVAEVKKIVESAAAFNGRQLPENYEKILTPPVQEESTHDFWCLFRSRYLRRITICFLLIWFTMNLVYYGLILNMNTFGGNVYLNSALAGLVEIPAIAIAMYIIMKVGKKWLFCGTLVCAGFACMCAAVTEGQDDILWLKITFLMIGKFTISAGNTIMPVYTAELYPTAIRNVGVGACNVAAGLALILTPYLSLLTKIESHLLMTLLTAWSLFGGVVVLFLPETMKQHTKQHPPEEKC
ncbi:organic cation transporter protein isoform X2 [Eupeodes corollae]|nr:organic cation transporter protein isoform X2 [Eupeodes corollae]XP_055903254.1 organic cation transporter protein isoform X2 [Eupeodes corollae]XP_055903255.1 organic cation transporter protein isoform X2 [Eupeodes corollae]XP_055903256.1 organic cation transporter protein isoform X2 [Eupeodes corollae]